MCAVPALVEGVYVDAVVFVFLQDLLRVLVRVEGVHEDQRNVGVKRFVQMLKNKNRVQFNADPLSFKGPLLYCSSSIHHRSQIYTEHVSDWLKHQTDHCSITHNEEGTLVDVEET